MSIRVWAIADLHLSFATPEKGMEVFGEEWNDWTKKIASNWQKEISQEDLVLLPGDLSWAKTVEQALPDLQWIAALPGTKVIIRGNHDYWWSSPSKIKTVLPPSLHLIQNNAFHWHGIGIAGARLWDTADYQFDSIINFRQNPQVSQRTFEQPDLKTMEKIYARELHRLELSLQSLEKSTEKRIAMTHYPPIGIDLAPSRASNLLEAYKIDCCVFGHLHSLKKGIHPFGRRAGISYHLTSCDFLDFAPLRIL